MLLFTAAKHAMRSTVHVQLQQQSGSLLLTVTDQGRGFSEDVLQRFGRDAAEMDAMWPMSSLSVGLTACKRTLRALNCSLQISNVNPDAKRKGARVTVELPLIAPDPGKS